MEIIVTLLLVAIALALGTIMHLVKRQFKGRVFSKKRSDSELNELPRRVF